MSDSIEPVVVDSPLPMDDATAPRPATPVTDSIEPLPTDAAAAPVVDESADKIKEIGDSLGYDFSRFKSVEAAEAAAEMFYEQFAKMGGDGDLLSALQPEVTAQPAAVAEETPEDLGLDPETDPKIVAVLKKMQSENSELKKQFSQKTAESKQQQVTAVVQRIEERAESFLDKLDSPILGKNGSRTMAQQAAAEVIGKIGGKMLVGMIADARRQGRTSLPPIEKIMEIAVKKAGFDVAKKADEKKQPKPHTLAPKAPAGGGAGKGGGKIRVASQNDPYGDFSSEDPIIRAIWNEVAGR